jgi:hypothetical protein
MGASAGLLTISLAMLALAYVRTHTKGWMKTRMERRAARPATVT